MAIPPQGPTDDTNAGSVDDEIDNGNELFDFESGTPQDLGNADGLHQVSLGGRAEIKENIDNLTPNLHMGSQDVRDPGSLERLAEQNRLEDLGLEVKTYTVRVDEDAIADAAAENDGPVAISIAFEIDGDHDNAELRIEGLPDGFSTNVGQRNEDGSITVRGEEVEQLVVAADGRSSSDDGSAEELFLQVVATGVTPVPPPGPLGPQFEQLVNLPPVPGPERDIPEEPVGPDTSLIADVGDDEDDDDDLTGQPGQAPILDTDASTPDLRVSDAFGAEDTAIALDVRAQLTDLDGSEQLSITLGNVPVGARLSAGSDNGDGTWTLEREDLDDLSITPPSDFSGAFELDVTATSTETSSGDSSSLFATIDVAVEAVLDAPEIDVSYGTVTSNGSAGDIPETGMVFRLSAKDIDGAGNTGADGSSVSNWSDLSGNGNDAVTLNANPSFDVGGFAGNGGVAFGAGADSLLIENDAAINDGTFSQKSFAFAFETGSRVDGFQVIYEQGGTANGYSLAIAPDSDTGEPTLFAFAWGESYWPAGDQYKVIELGTVSPNTSYSAAMVHDATDGSGTFTGYLNGDQIEQLTNVGSMGGHVGRVGVGAMADNTVRPDTLADSSDVNGSQFQGTIGEAISWNAALSATDIGDLTQHFTADWETPGGVAASNIVEMNLSIGSDDGDNATITSIRIDDLPDGVVLSAGTVGDDGAITLTEGDLEGLTITIPSGQAAFNLEVSATLTDPAGNTETTVTNVPSPDVYLDGVTVTPASAAGQEDVAIALDLGLTFADSDGSETVSIVIADVPTGAVLSAGTDNGDGTWTLTGGDVDGLSITPPSNSDADFQLGVTVTTTEASTGESAVVTTNLDVSVQAVADPVTLSASIGDVVEVSDGTVPTDGLVFRFNAKDVNGNGDASDNPADGAMVGTWSDVSGNGYHATTHGSAPAFDTDGMSGNGGVGFTGGNDALEVPTNADINTGTYTEKSFAFAFETGDSVSGFQVIYEQGGGSNGYSLSIAPDSETGEPTLFAFVWGESYWPSGDQYKAIELGVVSPNTSYSAAMVHDATDGTGTFTGFLNGDQIGQLTDVGTMGGHGGAVSIGSLHDNTVRPDTFADSSDTNGSQFQGAISEVASWNTALSADDIADLTQHMSQEWGTSGGQVTDGVTVQFNITAALGDTDGSETLSISVDGLPDGATLSAGTDNGDGSWDLQPGDLDGLTLNVQNGAGAFDLQISGTATEAGGGTSTTQATVSVADLSVEGATLATENAAGDEDTAVVLDIDVGLRDTDGSETLSITIDGVPDGATLSAGTNTGGGTWTVDAADVDGLTVTPAANASDDFQLTVTATTTETATGLTNTVSETLDVSVTGKVDDFNVSVTVGGGTVSDANVPTNGLVFHLNAKDVDGDGNAATQPADGASISRWEDTSGNNHDATPTGSAPSFDTDAFNGNGGVHLTSGNDGLTIANDAAINTGTYSQKSLAFTFETGNSVDGFQVIYEQGGGTRGYSLSIAPDAETGEAKLFAFAWNNAEWATGHQYKVIDLGVVTANTSYSAAMVHDSADGTGTFKGYLNGDLQGTLTDVAEMRPHGGLVGIGKVLNASVRPDTLASSGDGHEFGGSIGEIAMWNSALSDDDISDFTDHATQDFGTPGGNPEGLSFDLGIATNLTDTDGSETVSYVIDGLPDGGVLSAGTDNGDGTWNLTADDVDGLSMTVPTDAEDFLLSVRADVTETDGDSRSSLSHVEVDVTDDGFDAGLSGTNEADVLGGTGGEDLIFGNGGYDQLSGGDGADRLFGGDDNDTLDGGAGNDTLDGGTGNDIFTFGAGSGHDTVQGGEGWLDTVQLVGVDSGPGDTWSLALDQGSIEEQADGYVALSQDASGTLTLEDGSSVDFDGIERIEW